MIKRLKIEKLENKLSTQGMIDLYFGIKCASCPRPGFEILWLVCWGSLVPELILIFTSYSGKKLHHVPKKEQPNSITRSSLNWFSEFFHW